MVEGNQRNLFTEDHSLKYTIMLSRTSLYLCFWIFLWYKSYQEPIDIESRDSLSLPDFSLSANQLFFIEFIC